MKINLNLEVFAISDTGLTRSNNEDCYLIDKSIGFVVLADGMGGYQAGEIASKLAATTMVSAIKNSFDKIANPIQHHFQSSEIFSLLSEAVAESNKQVYEQSQVNFEQRRMGTTLVFAQFFNNRLVVGHVGDSKLFRYRGNKLTPLTLDHSFVQEQINGGVITPEQAKNVNYKNLVTRSIGIRPDVMPDLQEVDLMKDDIFLLCSDGLSDLVSEEMISEMLCKNGDNFEKSAKNLVDLANQAGGTDNVTVILIKAKSNC